MEKIFNQKSFTYFVWTPVVAELTNRYIFSFQFTVRCKQADIVPTICHWCRWHPWQIYGRCCWNRWQFAAGVVDTGSKFALASTIPGVLEAKFGSDAVDTGRAPWLANIPANFLKKFEMTLMLFSGAWGKMIPEKNLKQKISWHCPFKPLAGIIYQDWQPFLEAIGKSRRKLAIIHAEGGEIWTQLWQSCGNVQVRTASG